jgi:uncharacterized membrane protein YphA (DoxX/SURF4 family)
MVTSTHPTESTVVSSTSRSTSRWRTMPSPSAGWTGTGVRLLFGVIFGVDAVLKWLPGYRKTYLSALKLAAASQPAWLHGWFHFWITLQTKSPMLFATLTGLAETGLAVVLILGVGHRPVAIPTTHWGCITQDPRNDDHTDHLVTSPCRLSVAR